MPTTSIYNLPYLGLGDAPHIPNLGQNLAEAVEDEIARIDADPEIVRFGPNSKALNSPTLSGTTTVTSATYVNMPTGSSFSFTKRHASTAIQIDIHMDLVSTAVNTVVKLGVRINGVDYDITDCTMNLASHHERSSGTADVASGLAAGTYTIQGRWLRSAGAGTVSATTFLSIRATEVLAA